MPANSRWDLIRGLKGYCACTLFSCVFVYGIQYVFCVALTASDGILTRQTPNEPHRKHTEYHTQKHTKITYKHVKYNARSTGPISSITSNPRE